MHSHGSTQEGLSAPIRFSIAEPDIGSTEEAYVVEAIRSGWVSSIGKFIDEFEEKFAHKCEAQYGIATSNGTTALHLALLALGIRPGDEVIVPTLTFAATVNAVLYVGATPVFVDSEPETWCADPVAIERAITDRTRCIIVVHLYGHPVDVDSISEIAAKHRIAVVEDAAEAHGALYKGRAVGTLGAAGVFSFYGNKLITTGEGGMMVTNDPNLTQRARFLRDHAMTPGRRYWHEELGYNFRMTNIQAALGVAQLSRLDGFLESKRQILQWYRASLPAHIKLNPEAAWARSSYWLTSALLPTSIDRNLFMKSLRLAGIDSRPFFHPLHTLPYCSSFRRVGRNGPDCSIAEEIAAVGMNLPSSVKLREDDVLFITTTITAELENERNMATKAGKT